MKKSLSYLALVGIVASFGAGAVGSAPASAATLSSATRLVLDTTGGDPNGGVGEAGVGDAGGVSTTLTSSGTRWTVFESLSSDLVTGDTNGAVDVFVTNGTSVARLSVSADGAEGGSGLNSYDPEICSTGRKVAYVTENEFDIADANGALDRARMRALVFSDAAAKAKPVSVSFGSWGVGSPGHLGGEWLDMAAGVRMNHAAYKGEAPGFADLVNDIFFGAHLQCRHQARDYERDSLALHHSSPHCLLG